MGRMIVTTCGTSLLESGCWDLQGVDSFVGLTDETYKRRQKARNRDAITSKMANDPSGESLVRHFKKECWDSMNCLPDLSAEMASLRVYIEVLKRQNSSMALGNEDDLILLHSGNEEGLYCARVLEQMFHVVIPCVKVTPDQEDNLDPVDFHLFGEALKKIWSRYYAHIENESKKGTRIIFNLTGGYKAIGQLFAGLCSVNSDIPITIIYLHETAPPDGLFLMHFDLNKKMCERIQTGFGELRDRYVNISPDIV